MCKIKDRIMLGMVSGLLGGISITLIDFIFLYKGTVKTSLSETAAAIYVNNRKETQKPLGRLLGFFTSAGFSIIGGLLVTRLLSRTGKKNAVTKGLFVGITSGSIIPAILSGLTNNKIKPKDTATNLAYVFGHTVYGAVTVLSCLGLGHPSLFDVKP